METQLINLLILFGVPAAITGFGIRWIEKKIDNQEKRQMEREKNQQKLLLQMIESNRANSVGITAIAKAVQRIPDAHCNGDMTSALEKMEKIKKEEEQFMMEQGIKNILD